jgi:hypothetical protein
VRRQAAQPVLSQPAARRPWSPLGPRGLSVGMALRGGVRRARARRGGRWGTLALGAVRGLRRAPLPSPHLSSHFFFPNFFFPSYSSYTVVAE